MALRPPDVSLCFTRGSVDLLRQVCANISAGAEVETVDRMFREDFDALDRVFGEDVSRLEDLLDTQDSQIWRRSYCRALFAWVEAVAEWMRRYTIREDGPESLGEGEKRELRKRSRVLLGIFTTLDLFSSIAGSDTPLEQGSKEWTALQTAVEIRNRITHPKSARDADISDAELRHLQATKDVFLSLVADSFRRSANAWKRQARDIERLLEERNRSANRDAPMPANDAACGD